MTPDARNTAPTAQTADPEDDSQGLKDWLRRARSASRASTSFVDTNYRKQWEDSIRAFNNQHPSDSKFSSPSYDKRSKLFRPKLRAVMRKNEAAAAAAFFSNTDFLNIMPGDPTDKAQCVSAELCKHLFQYRLQKTIAWF